MWPIYTGTNGFLEDSFSSSDMLRKIQITQDGHVLYDGDGSNITSMPWRTRGRCDHWSGANNTSKVVVVIV